MSSQTIILTGVSTYLVLMLGVGLYAARKTQSFTDFVVAGRSMPLWLCGVSVFASWFGGGPMMGSATSAYEGDTLLMVADPLAAGACLLLSGLLFARLYRRSKRLTWPEFFEDRFGRIAAVLGAIIDVLGNVIWVGAMLFTFGVVFSTLAGVPMAVGIISGVIVVTVYTMVGGLWAVALTDFLQMLVIIIGLVVLLVVALVDAGGWTAVVAQLPAHAFRVIPVEHTWQNWIDHVHSWLALGLAAVASSVIIQRALAARTEAVAQNAFYVGGLMYLAIGMIPLALGFIARVTMPGLEDPNAIIPTLAVEHLHPVAVAVFVGAILSAIMSTTDSALLSCGAVISTNLLPLVREDASERLRLSVARYAIPASAILATIFAFNASRIIEVLLDSVALLLAGIIAPFILCFYWQKANRSGALAGIVSGLGTWAIALFVGTSTPPDLLGFVASLAVMTVVTLTTQQIDPPRPLRDADGREVDLRDRLGTLPLRAGANVPTADDPA